MISSAPSAPSAPHPATRQHSVLTAGPLLRASPFFWGPAGGLDSVFETASKKPGAAPGAPKSPQGSATLAGSRYIPAAVKRAVWIRDGGRCTFENCGSSHYLQYDHRFPFALGGAHTVENLRLLCAAHNRSAAQDAFGMVIRRDSDSS